MLIFFKVADYCLKEGSEVFFIPKHALREPNSYYVILKIFCNKNVRVIGHILYEQKKQRKQIFGRKSIMLMLCPIFW